MTAPTHQGRDTRGSNPLPIHAGTLAPIAHQMTRHAECLGYLRQHREPRAEHIHGDPARFIVLGHLTNGKSHFRCQVQRQQHSHNRKSYCCNAIQAGALRYAPTMWQSIARHASRPRFFPQQGRLARSEDQLGAQARRRAANRLSPNE